MGYLYLEGIQRLFKISHPTLIHHVFTLCCRADFNSFGRTVGKSLICARERAGQIF